MSDDLVERLRLIGTRTGVINRMRDAVAAREAADRIEKLEAALREIIGALNDPKGGQHVYDMRNASYTARNALEGENG